MNQSLFTIEEENLICAFDTSSRASLTSSIRDAMPDLGAEDILMREVAMNALRKLESMSDDDFDETIFSPAYDDDESEV